MCGIVGYIGKNNDVKRGLDMLKRLEYRGYDCLWPETLIQLSDGRIKTIEELELNSLVSSINLSDFFPAKAEIQFKAKKKKNKLYQIQTAHFEIKSSPEHKFFTYQNKKVIEKRAFEFRPGDFLLAQKKIAIKGSPQKLPEIEDIAYYQLLPEGIKRVQKIRKKFKFSYQFLKKKTKVLYVDDYLKGKRAATKEIWQKVLSLLKINTENFLKKYSKKKICPPSFRNSLKGNYLSPELSQIIGYIIGQGSRINSKRDDKVKIEGDKETLGKYRPIFKKIGLKVKLLRDLPKNCWQIRIESTFFIKLLKKIAPGILGDNLKRETPEIIQKSPLDCLAGFLRGVFDAEGKLGKRKKDGINLGLDNEKLLRQIQLLLLRLGIISTLSFSQGKLNSLSIYHFDSLRKFSLIINFSNPRKKEALKNLIAIGGKGGEEIENLTPLTYDVLRKFIPSIKGKSNHELVSFYNLKKARRLIQRKIKELEKLPDQASKEFSRSYQDFLQFLNRYFFNPWFFWSKIKKIEVSSSSHLMYDISIPKTQNFIANGLLVHNSAGLAVYLPEKKEIFCLKKVGRITNLEEEFLKSPVFGSPSILHTRWCTHGGVTNENAHPHFDCQKEFFLVHNGIIENYQEIKSSLIKEGHKFSSETDSEVLSHLIEKYFQGNLEEAVRRALREVRGTYGLALISKKDPQKIVAARLSSPLLLGVGQDEVLVASDPAAVISYTRQVINLDDNEIAVITPTNFHILKEKPITTIDWGLEEVEKGGFAHFMLKEIMEEPEAIENAIRGRLIPERGMVKLGGLDPVSQKLREIKRLILIGCGTAAFAAKVGQYMLEEYAAIPTEVDIGSEFRYRKSVVDKNTAAIFISQSGETADTLAALREMKEKGVLTLGITNVVGSSQTRETDAGIYTRSGPEIAVASTKAFLGQLATLTMLTVYLGRQREMALVIGKRIVSELSKIPALAREVLKLAPEIKKLAEKYQDFKNFFFLGRKYNYPIALEGALKLKEVSYLHSEAYPGGELKHGPLALIDENFPTIAICPFDSVYEKMISNIQEIKARGGPVIALTTQGKNEDIKKIVDDVIYIPKTLEILTPMLSVIPLHLFAYYMAVLLGTDLDRPKHLAKSVTVE